MTESIRIGCGAGFWGDSAAGPAELVRRGEIDFLIMDYLAEITMSILARMRKKRPDAGFATDFVTAVMAPLAREIAARKIKVVTNAGGVNPHGCREALLTLFADLGVELKVAVVTGDDVMAQIDGLRARGVKDLESGAALPEGLVSANAYLGAQPIAEALRRGADVVITGRCVDSALALGPLLATFNWSATDWDRLAMGSLAGHVIECGAQATGGIFTDWHLVEKDWPEIGFPIIECNPDGSFIITKTAGTGGLVTPSSVAEQIVYEVHDPGRYILADVVCDFRNVQLQSVGPDRVRVTGAVGRPATPDYKASLTYPDGYRTSTTLLIVGAEAAAKAERVGQAILQRTERLLAEQGIAPFRETSVEVIGAEHSFGAHARTRDTREVVVKIAAAHAEERALEILSREIAPAATSMAPSISGFAGGRPRVQPIVRLASALVPKSQLQPVVEIAGQRIRLPAPEERLADDAATPSTFQSSRDASSGSTSAADRELIREVPLHSLAHGRSGDKGNTANIGIIARDPAFLPLLREQLSASAVATWFSHFARGEVRRYEWPGLSALNFVLDDALGGGGIASLRYDPQGKGFAQILLEFPLRVPSAWFKADGTIAVAELT